ncbi:hypothetical protein [Bacillus changyiensis]|uniref:hypothetical protein n=1 Tax=Bacillus changyiensis TaxID=3004103 RepID=UPI0022E839CD|nr:hypothetical protein [Bacillus changyiensis]MDA1477812.1 hypothetical protein [Bacillus changyiensis]
MKILILFYLWIIPLIIGIVFFRITQRTSFPKRFYPAYVMIGLAVCVFAVCYLMGQPYLGNFFGGTILFGTVLPFMAAGMKKKG